jgi:hypothetical protein
LDKIGGGAGVGISSKPPPGQFNHFFFYVLFADNIHISDYTAQHIWKIREKKRIGNDAE